MAAFIALILVVGYVFRTAMETYRRGRTQRLQFEMFNKLLDKGSGSKELMDYLQSDAGQKLLESAPLRAPATHRPVLFTMQAGIVFSAIGLGCLALRTVFPPDTKEPLAFGIILLALGLGLLAASGASLWLSRSLGLMNGREQSH
jgi:hypothetical protein